MSAMELLSNLLEIDSNNFSKIEYLILEAELFVRICEELTIKFKHQYSGLLELDKLDTNREEQMLNANFIRCIITDILSTEEYSLIGIANYAQLPEEIVYDLVIGKNTDPSLILSRKILELHRLTKPELYREIITKIRLKY